MYGGWLLWMVLGELAAICQTPSAVVVVVVVVAVVVLCGYDEGGQQLH